MKYDDFKIFKFSTILKSINRAGHSFSRIYKKTKLIPSDIVNFFSKVVKYIFFIIHKGLKFIINDFTQIYKKANFKIYDFFKIFRHFNFRRYSFSKIYRYLDVKKYIYVLAYVFGVTIFSAIIYLNIPLFFNYNKSNLANIICKDLNVVCLIKGDVKYSFFPSPRIKFKNFIIQDFINKNKSLGEINDGAIKVSFYNLFDKKKLNFTDIVLENAVINFDLENTDKYKKFFTKKFHSKPINLKRGEINFYEDSKLIATIQNSNFIYKFKDNISETTLKGIGDIPAVKTIKKPFSLIELEKRLIAACFPRFRSKGSAICS